MNARERCQAVIGAVVAAVARHPVPVIVIAAIIVASAGFYAQRTLSVTTSTVDMISSDVPFRRSSEALAEAFPNLRDTILAVVEAPTPEAADDAALQIVHRLNASPHVVRAEPGTHPFVIDNALLYLPVDELEALADRLAAAAPLLAEISRRPDLVGLSDTLGLVLENPDAATPEAEETLAPLLRSMTEVAGARREGNDRRLSWQRVLMSDDGASARERRFILIRPFLDPSRLRPASAAIEATTEAARDVESEMSGISVHLTGDAVIGDEELDSVQIGGAIAALLSLTLVAVVLVAGLGSLRLVGMVLTTLVAGLIVTAGLAALVVGQLNLISVAFAVLFVGLGVDFGIHFGLRTREAMGASEAEPLVAAGRGVGCALVSSALCAAIGFLAFLPTDYLGLAELGVIAAMGMAVALAGSLIILPALLRLVPPRSATPKEGPVRRGYAAMAARRRMVLGGALVLAIAAIPFASQVSFDFNPLNLKDPSSPAVATFTDLARDVETTPYVASVPVPSLGYAETLAERLRARPEVGSVRTLASFVPRLQDEKLDIIDDLAIFLGPAFGAPPEEDAADVDERRPVLERLHDALAASDFEDARPLADEIERWLDLDPEALSELDDAWTANLEPALDRLRRGLEVREITLEDLPPELVERWISPAGMARVEARPAEPILDNVEIRYFARAVLAEAPTAAGSPVVITEASAAVARALWIATGIALVGIVILLALVLRSAGLVVLTLTPLALAALLTLAATVVLDRPFDFANVIVLPLLLGLGVNSGIHVVLRSLSESTEAALARSSTPRAVLFSSLTTIGSFGTLMVSDHRGMSGMGLLLTVAIGFTLLAVLVVLPSLLAEIEAQRRKRLARGATASGTGRGS